MNNAMTTDQLANKPDQRASTVHYAALALLIILASIERIYGIDRQSLWSDEVFAVMISYKHHFNNIWPLLLNDSHPPGYVTLMYWLLPWIGYSDVAIRAQALVYGIFWIPLVFWLGKRWFSASVGLLAAALVASSYSAIYFSQEARAYSMLVTFCLGNLICFLEILFAKRLLRAYSIGFIISSILILYLHYTCFVFFAAEVLLYLIFWMSRHRKGSIPEMAKIFGIPLLVYSPWLGVMYNHLTDTSRNWAVSDTPSLTDAYYVFERLWGPHHGLTLFYIYSLIGATLFAVYRHIKHGFSRQPAIIYSLAFLLVIPVLVFYIESQIWTPIFEKRYFLITLPLVTLLTAIVTGNILQLFIHDKHQTSAFLLLIIIFSTWAISTNIDKKIYTDRDKDPIREAVNIVKNDLGDHASSNDYSVIMSHDWFEHYLRTAHVLYDSHWQYRKLNVPQEVGRLNDYLKDRPAINYVYYLSWSQKDDQPTAFALSQEYKLVSKAQVSVPSGTIGIFKFNAKEAPDNAQQVNGGTNQTNEAAKLVAEEVKNKSANTYTTLMSHEWVTAYLHKNHIQVDESWVGRMFYLDIHSANLSDYLRAHPDIDTVYYFALRDPKLESAVAVLQLQYQQVSKKTVEIAIGELDIYRFNVRAAPAVTPELKQQVQNNPIDKAAALVGKAVANAGQDSYAVTMNHDMFAPYLQLHNVKIDKNWEGRHLTAEFQTNRVLTYLSKYPAISHLYYLALRSADSEFASALLQTEYKLVAQNEWETPYGKIDVLQFDTKTKPANINAAISRLASSPLYTSAKWIKGDSSKIASQKYTLLLTHDFFGPYLQLNDVAVDKSWRDRFYGDASQINGVTNYLNEHADITYLYYLALFEPGTPAAVEALKKRTHFICQKLIDVPPLGRVGIMKFNIKETPDASNSAVPACSE